MAKYTSGRQKNLKVGIVSYSENLTSLEVVGKVGIGTTNAGGGSLYVVGDSYITGILTANRIFSNVYGEAIGGNTIVGTSLSISGISTLGVTSATNLTAQQLNVSGISTLGVTSATNLTAQQLNVSGITTTNNLNVTGVGTFLSGNLNIRNPANTFGYTIAGGAITADRILTLPVVTSNTGIAVTGLNQTFTGTQTFSGLTVTGTFNHTGGTGTLANNGAAAATANIATGALASGISKTINFGTGGASGSFTQINIGPISGVGTVLVNTGTNLGIGSATPTSKLDVVGDARVSGIVTATTFVGALTGIAASATQLVTPRTFEITGDVVASAISFDGTGSVSLAATIQPNSVGLGTDTTGDYVQTVSGTSNQITVTGGTGESSTPTLSLPTNLIAPEDLTVTRDLQVNRNLNVNGNITIGGSTAFVNVQELVVTDPDIILGYRTDAFGNDVSNDNTANHGGVALASTEGNPLVNLVVAGIETAPATYKKIMWFKEGTFAGLGTDAWLINYAVGIGSTQFPNGTRLAAGNVQFTQNDLAVVRNINASGVGTIARLNSTNATLTNINSTGVSTLGITTFTGAVSFGTSAYFGDGNRLYFGNTPSLDIYHSSGESYIRDIGAGNLRLETNGAAVVIATTSGESMGSFIRNGSVELYYDNVKEFETTGYGATVFGILQSQGLQVSGVSTLGITTTTNLTTQNINNSGVTTTNSLNIGATQVISSSRELQNIISLDATTTSTIEAAIANGPNTFTDLSVTGVSTLGVTSATNLTAQTLNVSGVSTLGITTFTDSVNFGSNAFFGDNDNLNFGDGNDLQIYHNGDNSYIDDVGTGNLYIRSNQTEIQKYTGETIAQFIADGAVGLYYDNVKEFETTGYGATVYGVLQSQGLQVSGISTLGVTSTTNLITQQLNVSGVGTFQSSGLKIVGQSTSFQYSIVGSAIAANRNLTLPLITSDDTVAVLGTSQSFTAAQTFSAGITATSTLTLSGSTTGTHVFGSNQTSGTITLGGTGGTGTITFGRSTASQTTNIQSGASGVGTTKTINFGTGGASGSFTQINIGPTAGVGTVVINSGTRLGIGSAIPTAALDIAGDARVSGVTTTNSLNIGATQVISSARQLQNISSLDATTTATIESAIANAPNTFTDLRVTGISTFTNGPVLIGTATTTGTASQPLQVTGGAYISGNTGIGTTTPTSTLTVQGDARVSGVTTTNSLNIGATQVISSARQLQNIASLDATTTATIESAIANAPNTFADLNVTGITTLGITSATNLTAQQLNVSGVSTISVNSSIDALRITQLGTGNALVVEDSTNPDVTPFVVTSSGSVGIGTTDPTDKLEVVGRVKIGAVGLNNAFNIRRPTDGADGITIGFAATDSSSEASFKHGSGSGYYTIQLNGTGGEQGNGFNEKFRFTSAARLGIGKSNPSAELDVFGGANFTNRVLIGSATSTGTASQALQVTGGAYVSGNLGVGVTNPASNTQVAIAGTLGISEVGVNGTRTLFTSSGGGFVLNHNDNSNINIQSQGSNRLAYQFSNNSWTIPANGTALLIGAGATTGTANQLLRVEGGAYVSGNLGVGSTNPTSALTVQGDIRVSGVITASQFIRSGGTSSQFLKADGSVDSSTYLTAESDTLNTVTNRGNSTTNGISVGVLTATGIQGIGIYSGGNLVTSGVITALNFVGTGNTFAVVGNRIDISISSSNATSGYASTAGIATYATSAGVSTNLKGGLAGNIPYQSAADTTVFLTNGASGTILQSNGVGNAPTWVPAAPANAITGLTIRDEGTLVGGANSVSQLNFVGNIVSVASTAGIATITFVSPGVTRNVSTHTATAGQTSFSATYEVGYVDVYLNGAKLSGTQYTATNGTTIELIESASLDDIVEIIGLSNINIVGPGVGIATAGGTVGTGVTLFDFRGSGISTVAVTSGVATINITGGSSTPDISPVMMSMIF
jgi:hypothetical protein